MLIKQQNALTVLYCLMLVDGSADEAEIGELDILGHEICPKDYEAAIAAASRKCGAAVAGIADVDERYDILTELMNRELSAECDSEAADSSIPSRLLLWDMYIMSYSNGTCEKHEYRMIRHFGRLAAVDENIRMDMEQAIKSHKAVSDELAFWNASDLSYSRVRPMVEELETRKKVILNGVTELIADEYTEKPKAIIVKRDIVDKAVDAAKPAMQKAKEGAEKTMQQVKEGSGKLWKKGKSGLGNMMQKMADKLKSSERAEASPDETENVTESEDS